MARRAASLVQADYDRAVAALAKCGLRPEIIFDLVNGTVKVTAAETTTPARTNWQEKAPDRV
ncbi:hypothetical protein [Novosphingobium sp. KN65.2]|uniref:hypothetical protein n=1 Tax=Novosphingobium sp. KN65.2 TaxID=1478134 RepID=UPI0005DB57ED|nr:hypothetical protein [Novosphingobium sp. KN65.2]CDO38295.1 hypothetical protein SPHV1_550012 [Novosphingobium sp. KN65.2]